MVTTIGVEPDEPIRYTGGTIITSGSAVIPDYRPRVYESIAKFDEILKNDPEEQKEYYKQIREFCIEQIKKDSKIEEDTYYSQKKYGFWIFIIVVVLVGSGIAFSIAQLCNAINYGNYSQLLTSLEIQKAGNLSLTSSLIGAFVLTISLLFFFLFLQYVYKPNSKRQDIYKNVKVISNLQDEK